MCARMYSGEIRRIGLTSTTTLPADHLLAMRDSTYSFSTSALLWRTSRALYIEHNVLAARRINHRFKYPGVRIELLSVTPAEFSPAGRIMSEPAAQGRAGRCIPEPTAVEFQRLLPHPARPQAFDKETDRSRGRQRASGLTVVVDAPDLDHGFRPSITAR